MSRLGTSVGANKLNYVMTFLVRQLSALWIISTIGLLTPVVIQASQYACYDTVGEVAGEQPLDSPCPEADDIRIPMPGGLHMVFRAVPVPGSEFWGNPARNVQLGDPDARIFEGPRLVSVSGSFPSTDREHWNIIIGKYEVTVAQLAAVFGSGEITAGIEILAEKSLFGVELLEAISDDVSSHAKRRLLAAPARGLSIADLHTFIRRYTEWCYGTAECVDALPGFGSLPAFFRLPTEIEWEYAARQHGNADNRISTLPFDFNQAQNYAYLSTATRVREGPTSIGRLKATSFGVHDLYGNVAELLDGRFLAELGQGKPGMRVSRGGSYAFNSQIERLRPSTRAEVQEWRFDDNSKLVPVRDARLGIRLALGSHTIPDIDTLNILEDTYAEYRSNDRLNSASGQSTQATVLNIAEPLNGIDTLVMDLADRGVLSISEIEQLQRFTDSARNNISKTSEALSIELIKQAAGMVAESGRNLLRIRQRRKMIKVLSSSDTARAKETVTKAEKNITVFEVQFSNNIEDYKNTIFRLAGYRDFAADKLEEMSRTTQEGIVGDSLVLVQDHTLQVLTGNTDTNTWRLDIEKAFEDDSVFAK